jgi:hypothetical protein
MICTPIQEFRASRARNIEKFREACLLISSALQDVGHARRQQELIHANLLFAYGPEAEACHRTTKPSDR